MERMESKTLSHLIGNAQAKKILSSLVLNKRVPPVLLFHGPRGIGKRLFAQQLAQTLLGSTKTQHPDLHLLAPDADSDLYALATIRQLIQETLLPPFEASCKIFILDDSEKMLPTSSNALLKVLEEPPADTYFILLTSHLGHLLPTVISRCSKVPFYPVAEEELARFLAEKHPDFEAKKRALSSEGSVAEALHTLSHPQTLLPLEELFGCEGYIELYRLLHPLSDDSSPVETDRFFEEILSYIRARDPLRLQDAIPLISEARAALFHHLKFKTVLERFFIRYRFLP